MAEKVKIDGHMVDVEKADRFYHGSDGSRVSDEEWDISRDRKPESLDELRALGFTHVCNELPEGHDFAGVPE